MAPNDIYRSREKYRRFLAGINELAMPPSLRSAHLKRKPSKYTVKNPENLRWFHQLAEKFEAFDRSYIRRLRVMNALKMITHATDQDLRDCGRDDINRILAFAHTVCVTPASKVTFIQDLKFVWRQLLPELDSKGRPDETLCPYPVRHLVARVDGSRQRQPRDKTTPAIIRNLIASFANDRRLQAYVAMQYESLARPQELLYRKIEDVQPFDDYARVTISDHGKEGTGVLQCIDSFPYLMAWLNEHPLGHDTKAFLFCNLGPTNRYRQLKPPTINKHIRHKLKLLGIDLPITCYSLKRNGVTHRCQRGEDHTMIQHVARWTSTKQIQHYDQTETHDALAIELERRGLTPSRDVSAVTLEARICDYCRTSNSATELVCITCKRPLDREKIAAEIKCSEAERRERKELREELSDLRQRFAEINRYLGSIPAHGFDKAVKPLPKPDSPLPGTANTT